jgi:hypothetical protein
MFELDKNLKPYQQWNFEYFDSIDFAFAYPKHDTLCVSEMKPKSFFVSNFSAKCNSNLFKSNKMKSRVFDK